MVIMEREERMEMRVIHHPPHRMATSVLRRLEFGDECPECPDDATDVVASCMQCASRMSYRGHGLLRNGALVHYFECVHSPHEVYGLSFVIAD
jgi:hypothetical protein